MKFKYTAVVLALTLVLSACSAGPTVGPSPTPPIQTVKDLSFALPGGAVGKIVIKAVDETAKTVAYTWEIPPGYEVLLAPWWVGPEPPTSGSAAWAGGMYALGGDYVPTFAPLPAPRELLGGIKELRFQLWFAPKGERIFAPNRELDHVVKLDLNW